MQEFIPIIDIDRLEDPGSLAAIDQACREWGFFQVTGHGIDRRLIEDIFAVSREFFAMPTTEKRRLLRDAQNPWGYYDRELTKNRQDAKEIYDFGPNDGGQLPPRWPGGPFGRRFEHAMRTYYASCQGVAMRLLSAIALNLGVDPADLAGRFDHDHSSFLRLNYYRRTPAAREAGAGTFPFGVGEHTDSGALTVLLQDACPGLEVHRDGRWHLVEPRADALVVNIGDMVQVWSNDRYRAALHRAITNPVVDRYSVPFFLNPSYQTVYAPLPATVSELNPARYRPISWREFRGLRAAGDYADLGEEVQISHYRR